LDSGFVSYKILCQFLALRKWHPDSEDDNETSASEELSQADDDLEPTVNSKPPNAEALYASELEEIQSLFRYMTRGTALEAQSQSSQSQSQTLTLTQLRNVKATVDRKTNPLMLSRSTLHQQQDDNQGEDDPDGDLKAMILDANLSEDKKNGWRAGVKYEEFEEAMRRLPMFLPSRQH
jgi:hypothetical protein